MCSIIGCNQSSYYESEVAHCYYHHKIEMGLIAPEKTQQMSDGEHEKVVFAELQCLVPQAMKKIRLIDTSIYSDLKQHLYAYLWTLIPTIRKDAREKEVFSYIRMALKQEGVRFASAENNYATSVISLDSLIEDGVDFPYNPEDIFIETILKQKQMEMIVQFASNKLNNLESMLFNDLFLTTEVVTLRSLGDKYNKSHEWVRKYGQRLYSRFKQYILTLGFTIDDFF